MKGRVWIYSLFTILFLSSCFGPTGPDEDENFAGSWHADTGGIYGTEEIIELTDKTFIVSIRYSHTNNEYYHGYRGFVERKSDTSLYLKTYEVFIFRDAWSDPAYIYPNNDEGRFREVDYIERYIGTDEYLHYSKMVLDAEFTYGLSGSDLVIDGTTFTPSGPVSDDIPD